jgi:hypothetical protein
VKYVKGVSGIEAFAVLIGTEVAVFVNPADTGNFAPSRRLLLCTKYRIAVLQNSQFGCICLRSHLFCFCALKRMLLHPSWILQDCLMTSTRLKTLETALGSVVLFVICNMYVCT